LLGSPPRPLADAASTSAQGAAGLTLRLLAFSRRRLLDSKDRHECSGSLAVGLLHRAVNENASVGIETKDGIPAAMVDANELGSAILNLVINARDAMPQGSKLTVEILAVELDEAYCEARPGIASGP